MKRIFALLVAAILCIALFAGCAAPTASETPSADSSASVAPESNTPDSEGTEQSEQPAALAGNIKVVGSTSVGPLMEGLKELFIEANDQVTIDVEQVGSGPGIQAAMDGTADIGMASRDLKESETGVTATTLCMDGIAVIVNSQNPVKELTKEQIKKIYMGEITNWKEVGGNDAEITLVSRESTSGTRGAFQELVLGTDDAGEDIIIDDKLCIIQNSNGQIGSAVEGDVNAIGYMSLGIVHNYNVTAVSVDGVEATLDNVANDSYSLKRPFLLLTNDSSEPNEIVTALMDFVQNDESAKAFIEENGYILP